MKPVRLIGLFMLFVSMTALAQSNPVPLINDPLVPASVAPGGSSFTLTVNGTGFVSSSVVNWNGSALATNFVSNSQLTATVPAANISAANTAAVTVVNPAPGGGVSNGAFLTTTNPTATVALSDSNTAAGTDLWAIATGDFNGDGKLDLAAPDNNSSVVHVFLGNGDGTFQGPVDYAVAAPGYSVAVGDFNNDGKLDLLVAHGGISFASILLGNGDGTFRTYSEVTTDVNSYGVAVGDFNRDGNLDSAFQVSPGQSGGVAITLGNGDGTFQPPQFYATDSTNAYSNGGSVAVGDFNGDGYLDLVVADFDSSNNVFVFLGNGDGTFQGSVDYAAGAAPDYVTIGDFNSDGHLDFAAGSFTAGAVSVFIGKGDGTFQPQVPYTVLSLTTSVTAADFNGDGKVDLGLASESGVSILLGNGDGTFQGQAEYGGGTQPEGFVAGDFNQDGRLDLAVADYGNNGTGSGISILLQAPVATLAPTSLTFGNQNVGTSSPPQTVTLTNSGTATLSLSGITPSGDFSETNTCGPSMGAGASCTISVTFTPTETGTRTGAITITDNASGSPQSVSLTGTGTAPVVTLVPTSVSFGNQNVGTSSPPQTVTLTNTGTGTLTITSGKLGGADRADFSQSHNCVPNLAPGASCHIYVTFKPTKIGARSATVSMTDNAPGSPQTVSLSGTGTRRH